MAPGRRDYNVNPMSWLADLEPWQKWAARFTPHPDGRMQVSVVPPFANWLTFDLVAKCDRCPKVMPTRRAIRRTAPTETNFSGTWSCSGCGGTARVPVIYAIFEHDGSMTIVRDEDRAEVTPGPATAAALRRLAEVASAWERGELSDHDFVAAVNATEPVLKKRITRQPHGSGRTGSGSPASSLVLLRSSCRYFWRRMPSMRRESMRWSSR